MLSEPISFAFIIGTIALIIALSLVGVYFVNKKAKSMKKEKN